MTFMLTCILLAKLLTLSNGQNKACAELPALKEFPYFRIGQPDPAVIFDTPENFLSRSEPWQIGIVNEKALMFTLKMAKDTEWLLHRTGQSSGMHRPVSTTVKLSEPYDFEKFKCHIMFVQKVTKSFYLDIYEISRTTSKNFTIYYKEYIDIEKPSYESDEHYVLLFAPIDETSHEVVTDLRWHIRYHEPSNSQSYVNITLPSPHVYGLCTETGFSNTNLNTENDCERYGQTKAIMAPCPFGGKTLCPWFSLKVARHNEVVFSWPVGVKSHKEFITWTTLLVTVLCGIGIILATTYKSDGKKQE